MPDALGAKLGRGHTHTHAHTHTYTHHGRNCEREVREGWIGHRVRAHTRTFTRGCAPHMRDMGCRKSGGTGATGLELGPPEER
eukprot:1158425-Pelagomonas_calceolata.AAC.4